MTTFTSMHLMGRSTTTLLHRVKHVCIYHANRFSIE